MKRKRTGASRRTRKKQLIIFQLTRRDGHKCTYCKKGLKESDMTIDHLVPISRGGTDEIHNLVIACAHCNHAVKCNLLPLEFFFRERMPTRMDQEEEIQKIINRVSKIIKTELNAAFEEQKNDINKFIDVANKRISNSIGRYVFLQLTYPNSKIKVEAIVNEIKNLIQFDKKEIIETENPSGIHAH